MASALSTLRAVVAVTGALVLVAAGTTTAQAASSGVMAESATSSAPTVTRVSGADRYASSNAMSKSAFPTGSSVVYVANGLNYPDALSAAPAAIKQNAPLLLTNPAALPASVKAEIIRLAPDTIVVVGGPAAVSDSVFATLKSLPGTAIRIAGADRYATSRAVTDYAFGANGANTSFIATGQNFPDALSAGSAAGLAGGPVVLVKGAAKVADAATIGLTGDLGVNEVKITGGSAIVSNGIANSLSDGRSVDRLSGADRFATSVAINADSFTSSATVFLATGYDFPDALAGSVLAGKLKAPLFVVPTSCVPSGVLAQITRLGATKVVLLGGPSALGAAVASLTSCDATPTPTPTPTPAPIPAPVPSGPPSAANTGYPAGTPLTVINGNLTVSAAGTVVSGVDVRGRIIVKAHNVTIKNSIVRGAVAGYSGSTGLITATNGFTNLRITDVEIAPTVHNGWVNGIIGAGFTATRMNIHHVIDAVHVTGDNVVLTSSFLHDNLHFAVDPNHNNTPSHDDSIQIGVGKNISITGNTIRGAHNAALQITQDRGIVSNVTFSGNSADGGACTVNIAEKGKGAILGIVAHNNSFGKNTAIANCAMIAPSSTVVNAQSNYFTDGNVAPVRRG